MPIKDKKLCKPDQVRNPETGRCQLKNTVIDPNKFFGKNAVQERNKARQSEQKAKKKAPEQAPKKKAPAQAPKKKAPAQVPKKKVPAQVPKKKSSK